MSNTSGNVPRFYSELPDYLPDGRPAMTTFDSAIARAETDLAHVQSALDTAQQALEVSGPSPQRGATPCQDNSISSSLRSRSGQSWL